MQEIDFSSCQKSTRTYGGANGSKIGIFYNAKKYMLKFPPKPKSNIELSYMNSSIAEDIDTDYLSGEKKLKSRR